MLEAEGNSSHHQVSIRSLIDLPKNFEFDLWLRYVDNLPNLDVDSYVILDARLAWKASEQPEFFIVGQNLFDNQHSEFGSPVYLQNVITEIEHAIYEKITWRF